MDYVIKKDSNESDLRQTMDMSWKRDEFILRSRSPDRLMSQVDSLFVEAKAAVH